MITTGRGPEKSSEDGAAEFCAIQLMESINALVNQEARQPKLVLHDVMRAIMKCPSAVAVSYFERDVALGFRPATPLICRKSAAHLAGDWEPVLTRVVMESGRRGGVCGEALGDGEYEVAATVVGNAADPEGILAVFTLGERREQFSKLFVQLIAEKLASRPHPHAGATAADPLATLLLSLSGDDTDAAFHRLADELVRLLDVDTAFVGTRHGKDRGRLQAISGKRAFKRPSPATTVVDELISECLLRDAARIVTAKSADATAAEAAFLQQFEAQRCVLLPTTDAAGQSCGAVLLLEREVRRRPADLRQEVERLIEPTGQVLSFIIEHRPTMLARVGRRARGMMGRPGMLIALSAVLLLGLIPMPVRVSCDVELRPVTRRYVAAPHEGLLRDVLVQPGDVVTEGQVMARMDRREAELQLASLKAQYVGARKRRDTSLATRDRAETQISKLEMERLQAQMDLVERRLRHLEIRAPID
ncbi:MAG: biotin/lipoyl-binding protein, partial [Planctomycetota bacterium]